MATKNAVGQTFVRETIHLDDAVYVDCKFEDCAVVYSGGPPPVLKRCSFTGETFSFEGPAANTLALLQAFAKPGSGFQKLVIGSFPEIFGSTDGRKN